MTALTGALALAERVLVRWSRVEPVGDSVQNGLKFTFHQAVADSSPEGAPKTFNLIGGRAIRVED